MAITAIQDRLVTSIDEFRGWAGIESDGQLIPDLALTQLLMAAKQEADKFCDNPFEDDDGAPVTIPYPIKLGVFAQAKDWWDRRHPGMVTQKTGDLELTVSIADVSEEVKKRWRPYRFQPGL